MFADYDEIDIGRNVGRAAPQGLGRQEREGRGLFRQRRKTIDVDRPNGRGPDHPFEVAYERPVEGAAAGLLHDG